MQGFVRLWFSFCWKAIKSMSLLSSFSFQVSSRLTILCKQLLSNHGETSKQTSRLIRILLLLLLCVAKRSSSLISSWEADDSESKFNLARTNLAHTSGTPLSHFQTTVNLSFRLVDSATLPDYRAPRPNLVPRSRSVAQHKIKPIPTERVGGISTPRSNRLLGLPRTIFTACG